MRFDILATSWVCCISSFQYEPQRRRFCPVPPDGLDYDPPSLQILPASARPREVANAVLLQNVASGNVNVSERNC